MRDCPQCQVEFDPGNYRKRFCSDRCRNHYNQTKHRSKTQVKAPSPEIIDGIHHKRHTVMNMTIGEYYAARPHKTPRMISKDSMRYFAHAWNPEMRGLPCEECGYSKHTELAHIRAVSDFPLDTKLKVVHARENLRNLCPNCHWEFDNPDK